MNSTPTRPVIVGVEGSARSADAIALGDLLAERLGAPLLLVHTHPSEPLARTLDRLEHRQMVRSLFDSTFSQVQALIGEGRQRAMRVVPASSAAAGLQRVAERERAQLIVVGPSRRSGLGRVRPGATGERLLSGSPVPVANAPRGYAGQEARLERLASAFDGSSESYQAFQWAARLARPGDSQLLLASVHTPMAFGHLSANRTLAGESVNRALRRELSERHAAAIAAQDICVDGVLRDGDPGTVLIDLARDRDLLVLGSRGYGPLRAVLLGSVSQAVIRRANCPVVVVPRGATGPESWQPIQPATGEDWSEPAPEPVERVPALSNGR
ncbi:MAG: universal stress protein [Solirubrobacterales bacterium]